jgi:uncharacterized protein
MITESIKRFIEEADHAFVASAGKEGSPHLAAGRELRVPDPGRLVFDAWFCLTTLQNLAENPLVAVAVADPSTGNGYQFAGRVERREDVAVLDGYEPGLEAPGMPQVETRLVVLVESVMAFSAGAHTDQPLG